MKFFIELSEILLGQSRYLFGVIEFEVSSISLVDFERQVQFMVSFLGGIFMDENLEEENFYEICVYQVIVKEIVDFIGLNFLVEIEIFDIVDYESCWVDVEFYCIEVEMYIFEQSGVY